MLYVVCKYKQLILCICRIYFILNPFSDLAIQVALLLTDRAMGVHMTVILAGILAVVVELPLKILSATLHLTSLHLLHNRVMVQDRNIVLTPPLIILDLPHRMEAAMIMEKIRYSTLN